MTTTTINNINAAIAKLENWVNEPREFDECGFQTSPPMAECIEMTILAYNTARAADKLERVLGFENYEASYFSDEFRGIGNKIWPRAHDLIRREADGWFADRCWHDYFIRECTPVFLMHASNQ